MKYFKPHVLDRYLSLLASFKLLSNKSQFHIINGVRETSHVRMSINSLSIINISHELCFINFVEVKLFF